MSTRWDGRIWVKIGTWPAGYYACRGRAGMGPPAVGETCTVVVDGRDLGILVDGSKIVDGKTLLMAQQW